MSLYDRESPSPSNDRPAFKPLEPVDWFIEDPNDPMDATLHDGRVMYRAGSGLLRSVDGVWIGMPRKLWVPAQLGKVGATAGWVSGALDGSLVTMAAAQTAGTFIIPIPGLNIGDRITAVRAIAQVESAGGAVTLLLDIEKATVAAADFAIAAVGSQATTGALVADTEVSGAVLEVSALTEQLAAGEHVYAIITGTTVAATDVVLAGLEVDIG